MQQNCVNNPYPYYSGGFTPVQQSYPVQSGMQPMGANAVSINIIGPQAYAQGQNPSAYNSMYGANNSNMPLYPANYNNMFTPAQQNSIPQGLGAVANPSNEVPQQNNQQTQEKTKESDDEKKDKDDKPKQITPLTDEYVKSLENYLDNDNPKVRLIAAKELLERFKEDDNRKDNPSLIPLLNKALKDTSSSVRFLALTALQLGYSVGNDETVEILKQISQQNQDKTGQDALLADEILLKLSAPEPVEVSKEAE